VRERREREREREKERDWGLNSRLQSRHFTRVTLLAHFALVILEMGSPKLFAWAGLKL
jgi:hypothetical protein